MFYISEYEQEEIKREVSRHTYSDVSLSHRGNCLVLEINAKYLPTNAFWGIENMGLVIVGIGAKNNEILIHVVQDYDKLCAFVECKFGGTKECPYYNPGKNKCKKIKDYLWSD